MPRPDLCAFTLLPWDSELFGFQVARIDPEHVSTEDFGEVISLMHEQQIRLAYASLAWNDRERRGVLERFKISPVDKRVVFTKELASFVQTPAKIELWSKPECSIELEELALASGHLSRFRLDTQVPTHVFPKLYREWIRRSVRYEIARAVLVAREQQDLAGMVTVDIQGSHGNIGLIAVNNEYRGRGIGSALIAGVESFCSSNGATSLTVVTQGQNLAACALYSATGFRMVDESAVYHLWVETLRAKIMEEQPSARPR